MQVKGRMELFPGPQVDDDGNGYVDDVHGYNFFGGTAADRNWQHEAQDFAPPTPFPNPKP